MIHAGNQSESDELQDKDQEIARLCEQVEQLKQELQKCSRMDALTGVYNRLVFESVLIKEWERCKRHLIPLSLLLADIDCFKEFNDMYGYQAGDDCIKAVAAKLAESARRSSDTVCRFGGDKFIIVVPHLMKTNAFELASHIKENVAALGILHAGSSVAQHITVSIGAHTVTPCDDLFIHDFIRVTEIALYEAKQQGDSIIME
jgi:diguanylate cyclase (GGDEF)-like protein